jgi:hypothetical protein
MTTPVNTIPISVDYTSRDYYALREALVKRIQDRIDTWQGNDPADFGVALVEAFSYMGDLVNYYIDRIANESYILTATQRQNLLNLASQFGYTPSGYTAATVDVVLTNNGGYKGQVGGSILSSGSAQIVVPNDNPFTVGEVVNVYGLARSEYNGMFTVTAAAVVSGQNTISYVPANFTVASPGVVGNGTYLTFTTSAAHTLKAGQIISVTGTNVTAYNTTWTIFDVPSSTTFRVASSLTTTWTSGGNIKYANISTNSDVVGFVHEVGGTTVPAGTQLKADVVSNGTVQQTIFTTLADSFVPYLGTSTVIAEQGINVDTLTENAAGVDSIAGELIGSSSGEPDQSFVLKETVVDAATIQVYVERGSLFEEWTAVTHIEDYGPNESVFSVSIDAEDNVSIKFGDGVSGYIPTLNARIKARYIAGGGPIGNIPAFAISSIYAVPGSVDEATIMSTISVTNTVAATGGSFPESSDSIRFNAPKALRALNRAVTLEDFENLALSIPQVGKAKAVATTPTSIGLYIAPERDELSLDTTPGVLAGVATTELTLLQNLVSDFMSDKIQIGATVTMLTPVYTDVYVAVSFTKYPQYSSTTISNSIKAVITSAFSYNNSSFADVITPSEVEFQLKQIEGIQNVAVTSLYKTSTGSGKNSLVGNSGEMFVFYGDNITITEASADSLLASSGGLTISTGTLSPTYSQAITNYTTTANVTTSPITVTATAQSAGASITINNKLKASGVGESVALVTGLNTIVVTVTAANGVTVSNYILNITKS